MKIIPTTPPRLLAVALSSKGFGFSVLEGEKKLVNWGNKLVEADKNNQCLVKVSQLISRYQPEVLILEDCSAKGSKRSPRIKALSKRLVTLASRCNVQVELLSREHVMRMFLADGEGTKHDLATVIAKEFPGELAIRLPPKRKPWQSEDFRMDIFYAVALARARRLKKTN